MREVVIKSDKPSWDNARYELVITQGNDGDFYFQVRKIGCALGEGNVSVSTSGGNSSHYPGITSAINEIFAIINKETKKNEM